MKINFIFLLTLFFTISLFGVEESKDSQSIQRGFHFGKMLKVENKKNRKNQLELLEELIALEKDQLKEQKRIRKILEKQYDPQPQKFISKDGKECIKNSSAECYKYPILPSGQRNPVLAKFLIDPTIENGIKYKQWEDKHLSHVEDIGYSMKYAVLNNKKKSKTLIDSSSMLSGKYNIYLTQARADEIKKYSQNLKVYILMSDDGRDYSNIRKGVIKAINTLNYINVSPDLVFSSFTAENKLKKVLNDYDSYILKELISSNAKFIISKKTHESINPIAYPTYLVKYKDSKNSEKDFVQVFGAGNTQGNDFINNLFEMLVLNKVIDRNVINNSTLQKYELRNLKQ